MERNYNNVPDSKSSANQPLFDLSQGAGTRLKELPYLNAMRPRTAAMRKLETCIVMLHRMVYGRAGRAGERWGALGEFRGFPEYKRAYVMGCIGKLRKKKLCDFVEGTGLQLDVSKRLSTLAEGVTTFLMRPSAETMIDPSVNVQPASKQKNKKGDMQKKRKPARSNTAKAKKSTVTGGRTHAKTITPRAPRRQASPRQPSDDTLRVAVFRLLLDTRPDERSRFTSKVLRLELERRFGNIDNRKDIIHDAASECVGALMKFENRLWKAGCGGAPAHTNAGNGSKAADTG